MQLDIMQKDIGNWKWYCLLYFAKRLKENETTLLQNFSLLNSQVTLIVCVCLNCFGGRSGIKEMQGQLWIFAFKSWNHHQQATANESQISSTAIEQCRS